MARYPVEVISERSWVGKALVIRCKIICLGFGWVGPRRRLHLLIISDPTASIIHLPTCLAANVLNISHLCLPHCQGNRMM